MTNAPQTTLSPALSPAAVSSAYEKIRQDIHLTPLLTNRTISRIASTPLPGEDEAPRIKLWFKCENMQRIGAFKARGAFHAVARLIEREGLEEVRRRGVVTHSSGNHAQALALAASTYHIPAHIIMPSISTPSKIAGTRDYTSNVIFSGSTSQEREEKLAEVTAQTGAIFVPPYNHEHIILGQGTASLEMEQQYRQAKVDAGEEADLKLVMTPCGGGGLLSGTAVWFSDKSTKVFGVEPNFQGANDLQKGLSSDPPSRIENVKTLTIADGLRTPVGPIPWSVFASTSAKGKLLEGVYSVSEEQIKSAMRLVLERMKVVVEPSSAVPLAVMLYDRDWRRWVVDQQRAQGDGKEWDVGIIFTGGNTTVEAIVALFGQKTDVHDDPTRASGTMGLDGQQVAENVAG